MARFKFSSGLRNIVLQIMRLLYFWIVLHIGFATQLDHSMLTVRTMHFPRPPRAISAVYSMMLTMSFLMLVSSKKMTNPADSLDPRTTITRSCSRIDVYADAFVGCIRGNAKTLHRMVICSSDCNLRRDLNSLVMFFVSTHLTVDGRGSSLEWYGALNSSEMTESAVYDLDIYFQDVLARLVYYMAEYFIVASMSHCHKVN
jgi:hypothetical protein